MFFIPIESPERVTTIGILAANWFGWFGLGLDTFAPRWKPIYIIVCNLNTAVSCKSLG